MKEKIGFNSKLTKNVNRGNILRMISSRNISRGDITKKIGLTKMAVSKIVSELMESGYIFETKPEALSGVGRNPTELSVSPTAPLAIGLYISRNRVNVCVADMKMKLLFSTEKDLCDINEKKLTEIIYSLCDKALEFTNENYPDVKILGIGVSAIGPLDPRSGKILKPTNFYGISDYRICSILEKKYSLPAFLGNDMDASALAEKIYGIGKAIDSFIYLGITNGIGSGIVIDGELCRFDSASVGEIGHMCINFDGPVCSCGNNGCLEVYANMSVILEGIKKATGKELSSAELLSLGNDPGCASVFENITDKLAVALVNAVNFLDLQCILIGHEGVFIPDRYIERLKQKINERIISKGYTKIDIRKSSFNENAPLLGAATLVFNRLFTGVSF